MSGSSTAAGTSPDKRSILATIFISPGERRLRSGWRILLHSLLLSLLSLPLELTLLFFSPSFGPMPIDFLSPLPSLLGITAATFIARRVVDRRSFQSLGLCLQRETISDLLVGIGLSGAMMGLILLLEILFGWVSITGTAFDRLPTASILRLTAEALWLYLCVGFYEELLSRGYHLQNLQEGMHIVPAVLISSLVFGILHLGNPSASFISSAGIVLAGLFLAYPYLRTGQLWLSIGLHIGWNFFEGTVFGFPVSGLGGFHLLEQTNSGPLLWTGGAFGPEAGLILLPALLIGTAAIHHYTRFRHIS